MQLPRDRNTPWSDVSLRALIQVTDILSICCELWLHKNKNSRFINFGKCVVNVLSFISKSLHS
jgi:hypothetical protein